MNNAAQLASVRRLVAGADPSALQRFPGTHKEGYWHEPVVVTGCSQADEIVQAEIFGPVVKMQTFSALDTGIVWVNTHGTTVSEMPHGGVKDSGHGSDLALSGLLEYTRLKHAMTALS